MGYADIPLLYKAQEILLFKECYAMEKIDGTSANISWKNGKLSFFSGGANRASFESLFDHKALLKAFMANIGDYDEATVYGEAYGGKIQRMSDTYGEILKFIAFDVMIHGCWLTVPKAESVATKLGLEFVHYVKIPAEIKTIDAERDADSVQAVRNGMGPGHMREGVVLRPLVEVTMNNGERIIAKHKGEKFKERRCVPKVGDQPVVLTAAQAIANEWVLPERLEHVLQDLPHATGMEHTAEVIRAMVSDVYKEAKGEIVEGKEVAAAIGRRTVELWKSRIKTKAGF
jgi:hypothetical protein